MDTPLPESCRQVQGSRQASIPITSKQRTEARMRVCRLRRVRPITRD